MGIPNTLTVSTISNILACELNRLGIEVADEPQLRESILNESAELLYADVDAMKCVSDMVDSVQEYIKSTIHNYPDYFITGECN